MPQLEITPAETDDDLAAIVDIRRRATPDMPGSVENLRFHLDSEQKQVTYVVARLDGEPVACGYVEAWTPSAVGDIVVVPEQRRRGIGSAMLADVSARARVYGNDSIQGEARESDAESRAFLERRGFVKVGGEQAVVLQLDGIEAPAIDPPPGVRIATRVDEPDLLEQMYVIGVQAEEDIPGNDGIQTFEQWRANGSTSRPAGPSSASSRSPATRSSATQRCRSSPKRRTAASPPRGATGAGAVSRRR